MAIISGFDYVKGERVRLSPLRWREKVAYVRKNGGMVKTIWGAGETFLYMPKEPQADHVAPQQELIAEIYDTGF